MAAVSCPSFALNFISPQQRTPYSAQQLSSQKIKNKNVASNTIDSKPYLEKIAVEFNEEQQTYVQILKKCVQLKSLSEGKALHARIIKSGFETNVIVGSCLLNMYAKCRGIEDARQVFDKMPLPNVVSWTAMLSGYSQCGFACDAIGLFKTMLVMNIELDSYTFGSVIKSCTTIDDAGVGKQVHCCAIKTGWALDVCAGSALVDMYCKSGRVADAHKVFDSIPQLDAVLWTAMISGHAKNGHDADALGLFSEMQLSGTKPNHFTCTCVLGICGKLLDLDGGKQLHAHAFKLGFEAQDYVRIGLLDLYAKCGSMVDASSVFSRIAKPDVVLCTALIGGYARNGQGEQALEVFCGMLRLGRMPNEFTFTNVLTACANIGALDCGKQIHGHLIKFGLESIVQVGGALVGMYAKCGCVVDAHNVFDKLEEPSSILWSAIISGYVQNGFPQEALRLFCKLQQMGLRPSEFIFASILSACATVANLYLGNQVHQQIIKIGFKSDICVEGALIDMYANCGNLHDAQKVFDGMHERDTIAWTAMISGYAQHGNGKEALKLFEDMQEAGIKPNHVTFVSILSACSHAGLVNEAFQYFDSMVHVHGISPILQHYACIVDLLGRAGRLNEAEEFISKMPCKPTSLIWRTLLGACRIHGNMELGVHAAERILELEPEDDSTYVLLSNMYAAASKEDKALEIRNLMKNRGVRKKPGLSWIQIGNTVHSFASRDRSHPQAKEIYAKLEELTSKIKEAGYIPQTTVLLQDVEEQN